MNIRASTSSPVSAGPRRPYGASRFYVEIDGIINAFFTECTGLQVTTEVYEYKEGGVNTHTHKLPVRTSFSNITLKRGMAHSDEFWLWYNFTIRGQPKRKNFSIILYANSTPGEEVMRWNITGAYPIKWGGPDLKASDSQGFAIESIELVHQGFSIIKAK